MEYTSPQIKVLTLCTEKIICQSPGNSNESLFEENFDWLI